MKILWLFSFMYTLVLASQTQIVVGSYSNAQNATRAQKELNALIKKDTEFQIFFTKHALTTTYKKHEKYFRVVVEPFNDSQIQNEALKKFKPIFKDAYVMPLSEEKVIVQTKKNAIKKPVVKEAIPKQNIIPEPIITDEPTEKEAIEEIISDNTIAKNEPDVAAVKVESEVQNTNSETVKEEKQELFSEEEKEEKNIQNTNYFILLGATIIIVAIVLYFLRRESQYKKNALHKKINNSDKDDDLFQRMMDRNNSRRAEEEKAINEINEMNELDNEPFLVIEEISEAISFDILIDDTPDSLKHDDKLEENSNKN